MPKAAVFTSVNISFILDSRSLIFYSRSRIKLNNMQLNHTQFLETTKKNLALFLRTVFINKDSAVHSVQGDIEYIYSGSEITFLNNIVGGDCQSDSFDAEVLRVLVFFLGRDAGCVWWMNYPLDAPDSIMYDMVERFGTYGLRGLTPLSGMRLEMSRYEPITTQIDNFEIVRASCEKEFVDYGEVFNYFAKESSKQTVRDCYAFAASQQVYELEHVRYFIGYDDKNPVCIGGICFYDGMAGLYDVMTIVEHRNRGFARALVINMLNEVKSSGIQTCVLQSSMEAAKIYRELGFEPFENFFVVYTF